MPPLSLARLYALRACFVLFIVGIGLEFWPVLVREGAWLPVMDGAALAMLSALGLLSIIGLIAPVAMIPVLLVDIVWKALWMIFVAVPRWQAGEMGEEHMSAFYACLVVLPVVLALPWRSLAAAYFTRPERWR